MISPLIAKINTYNQFITNSSDKLCCPKLVEPTLNKSLPITQKWKNPPTFRSYSLTQNELYKFFDAIDKKKIQIESARELAELFEIPVGHLLHVLYPSVDSYYNSFTIAKKNGGTRLISAPKKSLKIIQSRIKILLDYYYRPKRAAHGFIISKGIKTNAEQHVKRKYVLTIDLENFFSTITFPRVYGMFKSAPFNFNNKVAAILAQACVYKNQLPQGAPTSPVISNIIAATLDKKLSFLAKKHGITYTRYADDITFSFNQPPHPALVENLDNGLYKIGNNLNEIVESCGFLINKQKFRLQKKSQRQEVTGLIVNKKVNVNRNYLRITRSMIHKWCKDKNKASEEFVKVNNPNIKISNLNQKVDIFRNHIYGRLSFIRMIRGNDFSAYLTMLAYMAQNDQNPTTAGKEAMKKIEMYDIFLCHASEDKEEIVNPLCQVLRKNNINIFVDSEQIKWGDSLVEKINEALKKSRYVLAILTANSIEKTWPLKELNSVLSNELATKTTKLLTLVKEGDENLVENKLPLLTDKLFLTYKGDPEEVVIQLQKRLSS
ncbi:reverse transcriptase domain-containing protein [Orbus wheelerorum]|uniref:reverse transcriptase domain-containing protein n=1 Tax=Orbus wheelerorum TaxID=3074111 RepID=UPI00370DBC93